MKGYYELALSVGSRLHRMIDNRCITQEQLSKISGVSGSSISKYINGRFLPNTYLLYLLCKALGCTASELLGF